MMNRTLDDVYTYRKQALDLLPKDHPHYDEIYDLLEDQVLDEFNDIANTRADRRASTT